ncbi:MAG: hypothetical protein ACI8ZO_001328 [Flavobacteriales bacterium]|jgi:hypothetical protein
MRTIFSVLIILLSGCWAFAQQPDGYLSNYVVIDGDTIKLTFLDEVIVVDSLSPITMEEKRAYYKLRRKVLKVYPYAKIAVDRLTVIQQEYGDITKSRKKRKYSKEIENFIREEFEDELRVLTKTEGRILIKLLHRNTGITAYDMMKDYRGWVRANFYQVVARFYEADMKEEFQPTKVREDALIEHILKSYFAKCYLIE